MRSSLEKILLGDDRGLSSRRGLTPPPPPQLPPQGGHPSVYQQMPSSQPPYGQTAFHQPPSPQPPMFHQPPPPPQQPSPSPTIPWLLISESEIRSSSTNAPIFTITRSSAPGWLSSKSLVTITRTSSGTPLGSLRFHSSTSDIDLELNGHVTVMKDGASSLSEGSRHHPIADPSTKWFWREKDGKSILTEGDKKGRVLASVSGQTLMVEGMGLPEFVVDEIVLSAVGYLVKRKKLKKQGEGLEAAGEIIGALAGA